MNFKGFDIEITGIKDYPSGCKEIHFSVDGKTHNNDSFNTPFEFIYDARVPEDSWFSRLPNIFRNGEGVKFKDLEAEFNNFVKHYLIKSSLTPKTQETFNNLIDEL